MEPEITHYDSIREKGYVAFKRERELRKGHLLTAPSSSIETIISLVDTFKENRKDFNFIQKRKFINLLGFSFKFENLYVLFQVTDEIRFFIKIN